MDLFKNMITATIFIFAIFSIGPDMYRYYKIQSSFEDTIQTIVTDAMDINILDQYKQDQISMLDEDAFRDSFLSMLKEKEKLDDNLMPVGESFFTGKVSFEIFNIEKGQFHIDASTGKSVMDVNPNILIKGSVEMKPFLFGMKDNYKVPFTVTSENKRYNN